MWPSTETDSGVAVVWSAKSPAAQNQVYIIGELLRHIGSLKESAGYLVREISGALLDLLERVGAQITER